jgi:hypothetical protein
MSSPSSDAPASRALRLHEILRDEHAFVPPGSADAWWTNPDHPRAEPTAVTGTETDGFTLIDGEGLAMRITTLLADAATRADDDPTDADGHYERLAEWIRDARRKAPANQLRFHNDAAQAPVVPNSPREAGASSPAAAPVTTEEIRAVLAAKAEEDLPRTEPWIQNADLRAFTRGRLKRHLHKRPKRLMDAIRGEHKKDPELNRMLLEDAFVKHVVRRDDEQLRDVLKAMRKSGRAALCLSGGGIRSATFALGMVQGLARNRVLDRFSYLSTVSGGGYLGSWLSAWSRHEGFDKVVAKIDGDRTASPAREAAPVIHLRQYSNYLSPKLGLTSADTWTLAATYLRNLLLIWMVLVPLLAAAVAIPWLVAAMMSYRPTGKSGVELWLWIDVLGGLSAILAVRAIAFIHANQPEAADSVARNEGQPRARREQDAFLRLCLAPLAAATALWAVAWYWFTQLSPDMAGPLLNAWTLFEFDPDGMHPLVSWGTLWLALGGAAIHLFGWLFALRARRYRRTRKKLAAELAIIVLTGGLAGFLLILTSHALQLLAGVGMRDATYAILAFPGYFTAVLLAGFAFEGLASRWSDDAKREWNARYSAWLLIATLGWLALAGIVLWGPHLVLTELILPAASGVGAGAGILTAILGRSAASDGDGKAKGKKLNWKAILARMTLPVAAAVAVVAMVIALSLLDMALMAWACSWEGLGACRATDLVLDLPTVLKKVPAGVVMGIAVGLYLIGRGAGALVETNRFSLHAMYRARLIRAYLGASRPAGERRPDPFTGFDDADNLFMGCLTECDRGVGADREAARPPFHVVNLALNLVAGRNLAWQERKAASFTVTPLHAGALNLGYRDTHVDGQKCPTPDPNPRLYGGKRGITLGTAMTISGAAASPNMGYHSSPAVTFLMTLFNARLGWWLGNPGPAGDDTFHDSSPKSALRPLLDEMLGSTDDTNEYVYLSDGGHFENLGLYEMVLRRNRFIVVSDAGCDETCSLEDLGNAIRKIRIDLGIPIDFTGEFPIRARTTERDAPAGRYWAFGRIRYTAVDAVPGDDPDEVDGVLLYVKPGVYGSEPRDVFNYAAAVAAFPHESTGDQFFSESQFESYRALGSHVMDEIARATPNLRSLFTREGQTAFLRAEKPAVEEPAAEKPRRRVKAGRIAKTPST